MGTIIVINNEGFGQGDAELGRKLLGAFLRKLWVRQDKPEAIILYNGGVKIAARGSDILDAVKGLESAGVDILACGTCVEHFGLQDSMAGARISNMEEISNRMMTAEKVVTV
ncbi:sulfurtransferase-like selenium metabolism protein YedF [Clostridiales bacterium F-3ap]|uniref:Sulfurtransferase-like selenium metabolism protein YedF n=2 Tax=Anaerotalea alkaliphila TaxID=2662126 RepID=A0A7X5HU14_9FIRM|nr:sulfurtransferase-like selenium metabolism protein YedF [Anaerotalea alkaliphila]